LRPLPVHRLRDPDRDPEPAVTMAIGAATDAATMDGIGRANREPAGNAAMAEAIVATARVPMDAIGPSPASEAKAAIVTRAGIAMTAAAASVQKIVTAATDVSAEARIEDRAIEPGGRTATNALIRVRVTRVHAIRALVTRRHGRISRRVPNNRAGPKTCNNAAMK
jgi:hypothetical protein